MPTTSPTRALQMCASLKHPLTRWGIIRDAVMDRRRFRQQEQQRAQREAIKRAEEQKKFRFSIHPSGAVLMNSVWGTQVEYCLRAILDELSLREPLSYKFWLNMLVIVASLLFQIFMRDCFVIAGFLIFSVPIERIEFKIYGMSPTRLTTTLPRCKKSFCASSTCSRISCC